MCIHSCHLSSLTASPLCTRQTTWHWAQHLRSITAFSEALRRSTLQVNAMHSTKCLPAMVGAQTNRSRTIRLKAPVSLPSKPFLFTSAKVEHQPHRNSGHRIQVSQYKLWESLNKMVTINTGEKITPEGSPQASGSDYGKFQWMSRRRTLPAGSRTDSIAGLGQELSEGFFHSKQVWLPASGLASWRRKMHSKNFTSINPGDGRQQPYLLAWLESQTSLKYSKKTTKWKKKIEPELPMTTIPSINIRKISTGTSKSARFSPINTWKRTMILVSYGHSIQILQNKLVMCYEGRYYSKSKKLNANRKIKQD